MKAVIPVLLFTLTLTGCGLSNNITSDFEPTRGAASVPKDGDPNAGPFNKRLMTAVSYDGLEYLPTEDGWITDQGNVPDLIEKDGSIYLYYTGWIIGGELNKTAVAISENNGSTWALKHIAIENLPKLAPPADPDVVLLEDGTVRLYFTSGTGLATGIYYAESQDGINFEYKGEAVVPADTKILDSTTFLIDDTWHMYVMADESIETLWHLISDDGIAWEISEITSFRIDGVPQMPSNGIWIDDSYHLFMFNPVSGEVRSQSTTDGYNWAVDEGVRIGPLSDGRIVKDPAILSLDNLHLMVYVTTIPE